MFTEVRRFSCSGSSVIDTCLFSQGIFPNGLELFRAEPGYWVACKIAGALDLVNADGIACLASFYEDFLFAAAAAFAASGVTTLSLNSM